MKDKIKVLAMVLILPVAIPLALLTSIFYKQNETKP